MLEIATQFASLLDANRYDDAGHLMADNCQYIYWEGKYVGREAIVNMYTMLDKHSREVMNQYTTETEVEQLSPNTFALHATGSMRIDELAHSSRFDELITIENGAITEIEYKAIPGEAEKLHAFYVSAGLA